ncbi:MAG: DUF2147 domain-containing protein [Spirosomataceae bacterium]
MKKITFTIVLTFFCMAFGFAQTADACLGTWFNAEKDGKIQIYKHGDHYAGKIIWLKTPNDDHGKPRLDTKNEDETQRQRPLLGLVIIRDFTFGGTNVWEDGKVYDPKNGKTYSCKMTLKNKNTLDVRGFIGVSILGRTTTWTRAE